MLERLKQIEARYEELQRLLADPEVIRDPAKLRQYGQESAELEGLVAASRGHRQIEQELVSTRQLLSQESSPELRELAREEIARLEAQLEAMREELRRLLISEGPHDRKNVILEIRAGTGGLEAALFAADLYRMYSRYAERRGWKAELLSYSQTGIGGFKEVITLVKGRGAYSRLKYERGVHRVQRVPATEASGRIHTSTATVAVLPEADEVEVRINPEEVKMEFYRASGPGGQNVQKTSSAVRLTHLPTGMVITCQDERSQLQNRLRAFTILRARLHAMEEEKRQAQLEQARRSQVGSGERSEKIRTYNFPQNRVTEHRMNLTLHRLGDILDGDLDELIEGLVAQDQSAQLQGMRA